MKRHLLGLAILSAIIVPTFTAAPALAQATRTWVSGVGDDANPCSRTAPCKTFAGAISKTATNGKINCLDPGGFGAVTITKSIEIDCLQFPGGILNSLTNGVIVNAPAGASVIVRGVEIHGAGNGLNGFRILSNSNVTIDKCFITAQAGNGVDVSLTAAGNANIIILDTVITQVNNGVNFSATGGGNALGHIRNVNIHKVTATGINMATGNAFAQVSHSMLSGNSTGGAAAGSGSQLNVVDSMITFNAVAGLSSAAGATVRFSGNYLFNNTATTAGAGTLASGGDNKMDAAGVAPSGLVTQ